MYERHSQSLNNRIFEYKFVKQIKRMTDFRQSH